MDHSLRETSLTVQLRQFAISTFPLRYPRWLNPTSLPTQKAFVDFLNSRSYVFGFKRSQSNLFSLRDLGIKQILNKILSSSRVSYLQWQEERQQLYCRYSRCRQNRRLRRPLRYIRLALLVLSWELAPQLTSFSCFTPPTSCPWSVGVPSRNLVVMSAASLFRNSYMVLLRLPSQAVLAVLLLLLPLPQ